MVEAVSRSLETQVTSHPYAPKNMPATRPVVYLAVYTIKFVVESTQFVIRIVRVSRETFLGIAEGVKEAIISLQGDKSSSNLHESFNSDDPFFDPSVYHGEQTVEAWKFQKTAVPTFISKPRTCKRTVTVSVPTQKAPLTLPTKVFKDLHKSEGPTPLLTNALGQRIANRANSCYIDATLQALRVVKPFRERLRDKSLNDNPVVIELRKLFNILEGKGKQKKREVSRDEIEHFRQTLIRAGMVINRQDGQAASAVHQEDPTMVLEKIFASIGLNKFKYQVTISHSFDLPLAVFNPKPPTEDEAVNQFQFGLDPAHMEPKEIKDFFLRIPTPKEVDPKHARNDLVEKGLLTPEREARLSQIRTEVTKIQQAEIDKLKEKGELTAKAEQLIKRRYTGIIVDAFESTSFFEDEIPPILPICTKRGYMHPITGKYTFVDKPVSITQVLDIPIVEKPGFVARYMPVSFITYDRMAPQPTATQNPADASTEPTSNPEKPNSALMGHYRAWAQYDHKGTPVYAEFDDLKPSRVHKDTEAVKKAIETKANVFLYQYMGQFPVEA